MRQISDPSGEQEIYLAGERVNPGFYKQVGGRNEVVLEQEDVLPASLDGRVACYTRVSHWAQMVKTAMRS